MMPAELTVQMQSVWCQDHVVAHIMHASVPPIVMVAQVPESSSIVAEATVGTIDTTGAANTAAVANIAMDIAAPLRLLIS